MEKNYVPEFSRFKFDSKNPLPLPTLNLSLYNEVPPNENEEMDDDDEDDDDIEELEIDENEKLQLEKVTSLVEAAYQRVEKFSKQEPLILSSLGSSETSSTHHIDSVAESLDGGRAEVEELKNLNPSFESALRVNQVLQRRLTLTLTKLEKTLQQNLLRQAQLKEEEEEHGFISLQDKDCKEYRNKYLVRPSSFAIPYFKDRGGTPAPMNEDAKFKVEQGYLDLYSTKLRTWLTCEQNALVKQVQNEWKNKLISGWSTALKNAERNLKNCSEIQQEEKKRLEEEVLSCKNHLNFFSNVSPEKIDMPSGSEIDWDKVAAQAFDGYRSPEECQLLWENYLHPSINKSIWSEEEDIKIQEAVLKCKTPKPDWQNISEALNTGRTAFQVMQRWVSFINPTIHPAKWTAEASKKLEDTINMLRVGSHIPWAQVCQHFTGYTKVQLQSRWRLINPETCKGPFTSEEDFVLIKGLYKFGMNFDVIAHFLPGRNKVQVRDRFKRAILPGLTSRPWTWREDKKIINNCSMKSQHWRLMVSLLPKRETCQIRLRFYTLQFWQSLRKGKMLPPPLFPLSLTTKANEVKDLREKIMNFDPNVRIYLDKIQQDATDMRLVKPFEDRREAVSKNQTKKSLAKFLQEKGENVPLVPRKIAHKRKRGRCGVRTKSWPDRALTEFFLPGRTKAVPKLDVDNNNIDITENYHRLSQALQLKIRRSVTTAELELMKKQSSLTEEDALFVNNVSVMHHEIENYDNECLSCRTQNPEIIPLMPPNLSTVGAFRSLLLHKPKLEEMASKEFLLFEVPSCQLHKLGDKPKTLNFKKVNEEVEIPEDKKELITELYSKEDSEDTSNNKMEDETKGNTEDEGERTENTSQRRKRKAATVANIVNYVYSQEEANRRVSNPVIPEVFEAPSKREIMKMQLEGENPFFRNMTMVTQTKEKLMEEEDKLLFHRLLSLFFWPALFTLTRPVEERVHLAKALAEEKKFDQMTVPEKLVVPSERGKFRGKLPHMDIKATEELIKKMEAVRKRKRYKFGHFFNKPDLSITQEDMKQRIFKKNIVQLKRSLVMKKAWENRRLGVVKPKLKKEITEAPNRRVSQRIATKRSKNTEREEEEQTEEMEEDVEEGEKENTDSEVKESDGNKDFEMKMDENST